ncbi:conserved hypothetical protein [Pseudomonas sp. OF001]|uniref:hypothetical protein n=1 Tax=Pseudomonas sp. OF001 TaxID=2772300 RepID=UPI00191B7153|nr:hypothetical protein [Pseudomonas sp. OF001]CAD5377318.1 conserved hypothetical protein [Pseudomonas sp. OF001]
MITTVPFAGFYGSLHESELDSALEQMFTDRDTGCHLNAGLYDRAYWSIDWQMVHTKYAAAYVDAFAHKFGIKMTFESLSSPREYNFTTDRIFAEISLDEVKRLRAETSEWTLRNKVREQFTSCDGFISSYPNDLDEWDSIETWDHNEVGTLLLAYVEDADPDFDQYAEIYLMGHVRDNGRYDEWFYDCGPKVHRLLNVHDYLEARSRRAT